MAFFGSIYRRGRYWLSFIHGEKSRNKRRSLRAPDLANCLLHCFSAYDVTRDRVLYGVCTSCTCLRHNKTNFQSCMASLFWTVPVIRFSQHAIGNACMHESRDSHPTRFEPEQTTAQLTSYIRCTVIADSDRFSSCITFV